ncbi:MAG: methyltransferase family protein [Planctomycetota bacterium]
MEIKNATIESFLKSFAFSLLLCLFWGSFTLIHTRALLKGFDFTELLWLVYNVTISLLFLIRVKPSVVSMNLIHWTVALITSFSGFFFVREAANSNPILLFTADALILFALFLGIVASLILGRSYDFLPALRRVKTELVYQLVRHPMYLSSIVIKVGYVLKNPSIYNALLAAVIIALYDKRAKYEEDILSHDNSYVDYLQKVKYRFIPGIY